MAAELKARLDKRLGAFSLAVELAFPPGVTALVGPSGAGKTTLLRCLAGLARPDGGRIALGDAVWFDGTARRDLPVQERRVGFIFQDYALFSHLTVRQNVAFGARDANAVDALIDRLELGSLAHAHPQRLSAGQQQRVAIARALAADPAVLLMDEPFASLDPGLKARLYDGFSATLRESGLPVVLVTHDWSEAARLADRMAVLVSGRVRQLDTPEAVLYRPATPEVAALAGIANVFEGVSDGRCLAFGPHRLPVSAPAGRVRWCVREDQVRLGAGGWDGTVMRAAITTAGLRVAVAVAGAGTVEALVPMALAAGLEPGAVTTVAIAPEAVHVFSD